VHALKGAKSEEHDNEVHRQPQISTPYDIRTPFTQLGFAEQRDARRETGQRIFRAHAHQGVGHVARQTQPQLVSRLQQCVALIARVQQGIQKQSKDAPTLDADDHFPTTALLAKRTAKRPDIEAFDLD